MNKYVLLIAEKCELIKVTEHPLRIDFLEPLIFSKNEDGCIDFGYKYFSDKNTIFICDDDGIAKDKPVYFLTPSGFRVYGNAVIAQMEYVRGRDKDLFGASLETIQKAWDEIIISRKIKEFPNIEEQ